MKVLATVVLLILIYIFAYNGYQNRLKYNKAQIIYMHINSISQIKLLKNDTVKPIIYTSVVSLKSLPPQQKKKAFISLILPSILLVKQNINIKREHVKDIITKYIKSRRDKQFLQKLMRKYNANTPSQLLKTMLIPPNSLVIAQAAIESGWGTSRFFIKANNIFGVWAFHHKYDSISAGQTRDGQTIHVRKYRSIRQSIYNYLLTLASNQHYQDFRQVLQKTNNPYQLANTLKMYSELRGVYTKRLKEVIKQNNLMQYDDYHLAMN